jgi:hypothetical protein
MTLLQPNLIPQQLNKLMSSLYARRLTFVRIMPSCSEIPGGNALRLFVVLVFEGPPPYSRVAGTCSKYGSYVGRSVIVPGMMIESVLVPLCRSCSVKSLLEASCQCILL